MYTLNRCEKVTNFYDLVWTVSVKKFNTYIVLVFVNFKNILWPIFHVWPLIRCPFL